MSQEHGERDSANPYSPSQASDLASPRDQASSAPLPRTVVATGWVSLLTDVATEMAYPLLPMFFVGTLGASKAMLGVIEGVAETTAALIRLPAGVISDRLQRRKPLMLLGYGVAGLVRPLLSIVTAPWQALLVRFADRFGKGIRGAPRDALITDVTEPAMRGRAFGFNRAMDHTGAAIGPLIAMAFLYFRPGDYRTLFFLTIVPGVIVLLVLWFGIKEPGRQKHHHSAVESGATTTSRSGTPRRAFPTDGIDEARTRLSTRVLHGPFVWFLAAVLIFTLGRATELMLLLHIEQLGLATVFIPLLWCVYNLTKGWMSLVGGRLGDRRDARWTLVAGWAVHVLVYVGFAFAETAWQAVALFLIYAVHFGLSEPAEKILVARWSGAAERGTAFGWYHLAIGVATLPASVAFGWLWDVSPWGAALPFGVAAAVGMVAMLVLLWAFRSAE